jgi:hypothetical protein
MDHQEIDKVSLELARRVAARLRETPDLLSIARSNLERWTRLNANVPSLLRCYTEWGALLACPLDEILLRLCAETEEGQRLRQNSPFAGILSPAEVWQVKREFRRSATAAACAHHPRRHWRDRGVGSRHCRQPGDPGFPTAPGELLASIEADVFTLRDPADSDLIDGSIGEGSPFHQTFGYYAHGVGVETSVLPTGWRGRLVRVENENTGGRAGLCLEVHDLAVSKLVAGREKDLAFVASLLRLGLADAGILEQRLEATPLDPVVRTRCGGRLRALVPKN